MMHSLLHMAAWCGFLGAADVVPWDMAPLERPPKVYPAPDMAAEGVRGLYYDGLPWRGEPTRVFAWFGLPERAPGEKVPAMVLAHGGGGTAFDEWVRIWNRRGYAAIAMDLEGTLPIGEHPNRTRHEWAGPKRLDAFDDIDDSPEDQWFYHAVADIALAHSLLRSMPEIDPDRIGLTGISWGGILACTVAGVDHRFRCTIPVYGCGYLDEAPVFQSRWEALGPERSQRWNTLWDPASHLARATAPMLWVNGGNDLHFPLSIHGKSYGLAGVPKTLSVQVGLFHSHHHGWGPEEIYAYADAVLRDGTPLARITNEGCEGRAAWATFEADSPITKAELVYCSDTTDWVACDWVTLPATIDESTGRVSATLPEGCRAYFLNLTDARGLVVSTAVEEARLE